MLLQPACRPQSGPDAVTPARASQAEPDPAGVTEAPEPPREPTHPLELLPATTQGVLVAESPARLVEVLGLSTAIAEHGPTFDEWQREIVTPLGFDPLDPSALPSLGIDPSGPCGIALLDVNHEAFAFFATVAREEPILELVKRFVPDAAHARRGDARIITLERDAAIVLRAGFVAVVVIDRLRDQAPAFAEAIATGDGKTSLPHGPAWRAARAPLPTEADLVGFFDVAGTTRRALAHQRRRRGDVESDFARELAEARSRGATAQEIADLQRAQQDRRQRAVQDAAEAARIEHVAERLVGSVEGIAFAVDSTPDGLLGSLHVALTPTAPWRDLFRTETHTPPALTALGDRPLLVGSAAVDVDVLVGVFDEILQIDGKSFEDLRRETEREAGIDVLGILRPLVDGRAAGALTIPRLDGARAPEELGEMIGGFVSIGVTDPVRGAAVLDTLAAFLKPAGLVKALPGGGHRFTIDGGPAIHAAAIGDSIVATTDPDHLGRIRASKPGPGIDAVRPIALREPLVRGGAAMRLGMHHGMLFGLVWGLMRSFPFEDFRDDPLTTLSGEFSDVDVHAMSRSAATKRAQKRFDRADAGAKKAREALRREESRRMFASAERLGTTYGHIREVPSGLLAEGGHYVEGGAPTYLDAILDFAELDKLELSERTAMERTRADADTARQALLEALRVDATRARSRVSSP
jgi:hypothetical protein